MVYFLVLIEQDQDNRPAAYAEYIAQVKPIVERYGGLYSFSVREGKFVLRVSL